MAIIGSGNVGKALAGSFTTAGHDVVIGSAHPEDTEAVALELVRSIGLLPDRRGPPGDGPYA